MPPASSMPKRSGARSATCTPRHGRSATKRPTHAEHADEAELLADDGEDEVGVGVGQEAPLRPGWRRARRR